MVAPKDKVVLVMICYELFRVVQLVLQTVVQCLGD